MCLIVFAWNQHPDYRLILAANRDEFHRRPTQDAHWWPDKPSILAGRDLQAGGTWLALNRKGRFATITNYREQTFTKAHHNSRGELVTEFVNGDQDPASFSRGIDGPGYAGFNLISADFNDDNPSISYVSNRDDPVTELDAGIYGLSNASLDTPWVKLTRSKASLTQLIADDDINETSLMRILADKEIAKEDADTEYLSIKQARAITAPFIITEDYGTRCSTVLLWHNSGKVEFTERRFDAMGGQTGQSRFTFEMLI
jgi:uncharacterized protein with NRDE domain